MPGRWLLCALLSAAVAVPSLVRKSTLTELASSPVRITVTVARARGQCTLDVRDSGPGVPMELRDRVFEPFFTTKSRGGGLGLPIARRTAELHGGTLTLASAAAGGATFRLVLPCQPSGRT